MHSLCLADGFHFETDKTADHTVAYATYHTADVSFLGGLVGLDVAPFIIEHSGKMEEIRSL